MSHPWRHTGYPGLSADTLFFLPTHPVKQMSSFVHPSSSFSSSGSSHLYHSGKTLAPVLLEAPSMAIIPGYFILHSNDPTHTPWPLVPELLWTNPRCHYSQATPHRPCFGFCASHKRKVSKLRVLFIDAISSPHRLS